MCVCVCVCVWLLVCKFWWEFCEGCTASSAFGISHLAAEHDEDDAIEDGQTDEQSHCKPCSDLGWTEVDTRQVVVISDHA